MNAILDHWQTQLLGTFLGPGSTLSVAALAVTFGLAVSILAARKASRRPLKLSVAWRAIVPRRLWKSASGRADLGWFLFSLLGSGLIFGWAVLATGTVARAVDAALGEGSLFLLDPFSAIALATLATFIAYEFAYWFDHWLMHRVPWLWAFHRVHHSAEHLSLLTIFRVHPLESVIFYNLLALIIGAVQGVLPHVIGAHAAPQLVGQTNVILFGFAVLVTHLQHSHLWVGFGPFWGRLLLGPAHHQIHHSHAPEHFDRNLGNVLTLFDRLFGTFHMPPAERPALTFGTDLERAKPHGLAAMTLLPFADAAGVLRGEERMQATTSQLQH